MISELFRLTVGIFILIRATACQIWVVLVVKRVNEDSEGDGAIFRGDQADNRGSGQHVCIAKMFAALIVDLHLTFQLSNLWSVTFYYISRQVRSTVSFAKN